MVDVIAVVILDSKIIDVKGEQNLSFFMLEQARGVWLFMVSFIT